MKKIQKYQNPVFITASMLKNGWSLNGTSFYCINGSMLILHLTIRNGEIGISGTELLKIPLTMHQSWSPNMFANNGALVLNQDGSLNILTEVVNPKTANINVDIITILK